MDGYFHLDQTALMEFRLLHLFLEIWKYFHTVILSFNGNVVVPGKLNVIFYEHTSIVPRWFHVSFLVEFFVSQQNVGDGGSDAIPMTYVSVSVANSFVHSFTPADFGYHFFGEFARFIDSLL